MNPLDHYDDLPALHGLYARHAISYPLFGSGYTSDDMDGWRVLEIPHMGGVGNYNRFCKGVFAGSSTNSTRATPTKLP